MPNQENYAQSIAPFINGDELAIGSSVFRFAEPQNPLIRNIIGDNEIGLDGDLENLEIHLYELATDDLVKSIRIPFSENYLYVRREFDNNIQFGLELWNPEKPSESLLTKYLSDVPAGYYNIVINFFSDEIGTYFNPGWRIKQISPTRTEIIIEPVSAFDRSQFEQFIYKSIFVTDFRILLIQLFDKDKQSNLWFSSLRSQFQNRLFNDAVEYIAAQDPSYRNRIEAGLNEIFALIYSKLELYITSNIDEKKYRILKTEFQSELRKIVFDTVRDNISRLPEPNTVMRAQ